jgi:surface protein
MRKVNKIELRNMILNGEDITKVDYSGIHVMCHMFSECPNLVSIPWMNTSNVTDMEGMFQNCSKLKSVPELDTSKVWDMRFMFDGCVNLVTIPDLDTSSVENMNYFLFRGCKNLEKVNHWNFPDYDWEDTRSNKLIEKYPELFI